MVILLGGLAGKLLIDLLPPTWAGSAGLVAVVLVGFAGLGWLAVECRWGAREIGLLGAAAIIGGTRIGFLTPPPEGVAVATKYAQNLVLLALAVEIAAWVHDLSLGHRAQSRHPPAVYPVQHPSDHDRCCTTPFGRA